MIDQVPYVKPDEFERYHTEVIMASNSQPRKRLLLVIDATTNRNANIDLIIRYHVTNRYDQIIHCGNHLKPAIKEYNKL